MKKLVFIVIIFVSNSLFASSDIDTQIRNSIITLSAFECSLVAKKKKESERLFILGLKSGRSFLNYIQANGLDKKVAESKIPSLWLLTKEPSIDFILGLIYSDRQKEVYEKFVGDYQRRHV